MGAYYPPVVTAGIFLLQENLDFLSVYRKTNHFVGVHEEPPVGTEVTNHKEDPQSMWDPHRKPRASKGPMWMYVDEIQI